MTTKVEVKNVSFDYGKVKALENISFELENGKIYGLIGRNGAGKTSLLSLLASYRQPTEGSIELNGKAVFENQIAMQDILFIYDKDYSDESTSVGEWIKGMGSFRSNYDQDYADYLTEKFNLSIDKPVYELSKGQLSAMNVIIGLAIRTPVTIFDEAYLGMDAPNRELFYEELLKDQERYPRIFIFSTHLVSETDYLFDQVIIIHKGSILLNESYEKLLEKGFSITGSAEAVDTFITNFKDMEQLNKKSLGKTTSVMLYGQIGEAEQQKAKTYGLDIGPVSLQDLFIHLTKEEVPS